ncbi:MAG TPA: hemerythrin domain-containing protein [Rhizomicrobium sp.]|nr:hemerythrin domain-containing protein [Rhizomicrobium sp.]
MSLKTTIEKAGQNISKTLKGALAPQPSDDILATLHKEHDEVQALLGKLVDSESAPERRGLLQQIKEALVPHAKAEEKVVYDRVLALKGKKSKVDAHEGYFEHEAADRMLANLGKIEKLASPEFTAAAKVLKELIAHHVGEEERDIWSDVRENFSLEQREKMHAEFEAAKKRVRIPN